MRRLRRPRQVHRRVERQTVTLRRDASVPGCAISSVGMSGASSRNPPVSGVARISGMRE